jgi:hypothetical protein
MSTAVLSTRLCLPFLTGDRYCRLPPYCWAGKPIGTLYH